MVGQLAYAYEKHSLILTFPTGPQSSRERFASCVQPGMAAYIFVCFFLWLWELVAVYLCTEIPVCVKIAQRNIRIAFCFLAALPMDAQGQFHHPPISGSRVRTGGIYGESYPL